MEQVLKIRERTGRYWMFKANSIDAISVSVDCIDDTIIFLSSGLDIVVKCYYCDVEDALKKCWN